MPAEEIKKLVLVNGVLQIKNEPQKENNKEQLYQEYQQKFQEISASVSTLTNEILTNLSNVGYTIQKIT